MMMWSTFATMIVPGNEPELLDPVEAAAVNRPQLAQELRVARGLEVVIEPDEVERRSDPGHADDDVRPAQCQVDPLEKISFQRLSAAPKARIAPRRAFERQMVMLIRIRDAEPVAHDVEKRHLRQRHLLLA